MQEFIVEFSYLGLFIVSVISSATVIFPLPIGNIAVGLAGGFGLNPILASLVSGLGLATGEFTGYAVGYGGRHVIKKKKKKLPKLIVKFEKFFEKYGFWGLMIISWAPLPFLFDFVGILSGMSQYNIKKFFVAVLIGKILKALMFAFAGYLIVPWVLQNFGISLHI